MNFFLFGEYIFFAECFRPPSLSITVRSNENASLFTENEIRHTSEPVRYDVYQHYGTRSPLSTPHCGLEDTEDSGHPYYEYTRKIGIPLPWQVQ